MEDDKPLRDPARKKALSYVRDRRNTYGQNDKAARRAIPARKAGESRKSRRKAGHALKVIERADEASAAISESSLAHDIERVGGWTKSPDKPLGEVVQRGIEARIDRVGRKSRAAARSIPSIDPQVVAEFTAPLRNTDNLSKRRQWRELRRLLKERVRRRMD
jgi:ribosomal protein L32